MSGDWIHVRRDLGDDPAVISIADACKLDQDAVVGKLVRLWSWANGHTEDGYVPGIGERWIDEFARRKGFAKAMQSAGWIELSREGIRFPNFARWNGESAKHRINKNRRQATWRDKQASTETSTQTPINTSTPASTGPPQNRLPEKRREENKDVYTGEGGGVGEGVSPPGNCSPASPDSPAGRKPGAGKPKNGHHAKPVLGSRLPSDWRIPDEYRDWALAAYPDLDPQRVVRMSLEFRDYWTAVPGQRGRKTDWQATWRNNVRKKMGDA